MHGAHTFLTTSEGIERLRERPMRLLDDPPTVRPHPQVSWGPDMIHQLIAPRARRLPFERAWRDPSLYV